MSLYHTTVFLDLICCLGYQLHEMYCNVSMPLYCIDLQVYLSLCDKMQEKGVINFLLLCRWLNRKGSYGKYMFHAGFLGMDNVSCVDRSNLPSDCTTIDQVISVFSLCCSFLISARY